MFSSCILALSRTVLRLICATASFDFAVLISFSQEWNSFIHCNLRSVQNPNASNPHHNGISATNGTFRLPMLMRKLVFLISRIVVSTQCSFA